MAQLSDDCFAFGGPMMSVDEAVGIIAARVTPVSEVETVALADADGRILAHDVAAPLPLPPFTNSAVDGYAVSSRDLPKQKEQAFPVTGRVQAGASAQAPIEPGQAMRIFTGAPMPEGADTVFMQEDVRLEGGKVVLPAGLKPGANVRPAGEDIPVGHAALKAGQRLRPQDVALAAAFGLTQLDVRQAHPRRGVLHRQRTGLAGRKPRGGATVRFQPLHADGDAGPARLRGQRSRHPAGRSAPRWPARLQKVAGTHDLILTTGGVSTGEEDHVKASVESVGTLVLWRMAIKPGRPVAMGIIGGTPFIGLPGNPVASFVTFVHVVRPTVLALAGARQQALVPMPVRAALPTRRRSPAANMSASPCARREDGALEAVKFPREGAGLLSSLVDTDGLVELGEEITAGRARPDGRVSGLCEPDAERRRRLARALTMRIRFAMFAA